MGVTRRRCVAAACGVLACVMMLAACGGQTEDTAVPDGTGERLASSFTAYAEQLLERDGDVLAPAQYEVLEQAARTGEISAADYAAAWSDFSSCVVDSGYPRPDYYMLENGLYQGGSITAPPEYNGDIAYGERLLEASSVCKTAHLIAIQEFYQAQAGNPNLYADRSEGAVDCLRRAELVPQSYTIAQYREERDLWNHNAPAPDMILDLNSAEVRGCLAANDTDFTFPWGSED
ncbi:hypothetical protein [Bifidobacterium samirii]|uniref:Lipoprotein n=1 Tax=Bifidobacterium samirii TaxID=2306974 RepID=A0A430FWY4_9BIFI|nr:hypothetical protein [Bifidobacterium samirii]RSX58887.1 hypothetical protein D2E24_0183 [Bifidobacterium samirii]